MVELDQLLAFLDQVFQAHQYEESTGLYLPGKPVIGCLGLALEPWSELSNWAIANQIDALFLHRPWQLDPTHLPPQVGVIAYHLPFDEQLTLGFNSILAEALELTDLEVLGYKQGRPIGMIGAVAPQNVTQIGDRVHQVLGGYTSLKVGAGPTVTTVERVAVVGAMTDALVREAKTRGASVYITGQLRKPAQAAVLETGMTVIEVGHQRSEKWGLQALARLVRDRWPQLQVSLPYP